MRWAKERWNAWRTETRERAHERRAAKAAAKEAQIAGGDSGHPAYWLLSVLFFAVIFAAVVEWVWALLFCIEATGHIDWNLDAAVGNGDDPALFLWNFAFSAHWPVFIGLVMATVPIVAWSMIWLPVVMMAHQVGRWRKGTMIGAGLLCNLIIIISGTVVMNYNRQEQVRETLIVQEQAAADRAAIVAQRTALETRLREMRNHENQYMAVAATVGAAEFERTYLSAEQRRSEDPARVRLLERSLGAARQADALEAQIVQLIAREAQAPTESAVAANVKDETGAAMNAFAQQVEVWRPPALALSCTLIGIFGAWWLVGVYDRVRQNAAAAREERPIDPARTLEDMRDETPYRYAPPRTEAELGKKEEMFDAITGERVVRVGAHTRKITKKGKTRTFAEVVIPPEAVPGDERGAQMPSDERVASGGEQPHAVEQGSDGDGDERAEKEVNAPSGEIVHDNDLTDEELAALVDAEPEEASDAPPADAPSATPLPDSEGVAVGEPYGPPRPPENNPRRILEAAE